MYCTKSKRELENLLGPKTKKKLLSRCILASMCLDPGSGVTRPSSSIIASPQPSSSSATGSTAALDAPTGSTVAADVPTMLAAVSEAPQPSSSKPLNPEY